MSHLVGNVLDEALEGVHDGEEFEPLDSVHKVWTPTKSGAKGRIHLW